MLPIFEWFIRSSICFKHKSAGSQFYLKHLLALTTGKQLQLSEPQLSYLWSEDNNSNLAGILWDGNRNNIWKTYEPEPGS